MRAVLILGILLLAALSGGAGNAAAQSGAATAWEQTDPAGDQYVDASDPFGVPPVPVPATPATSHTDIKRVTLDSEDEAGLNFTIYVQALKVQSIRPDTSPYFIQCGFPSSTTSLSPTATDAIYSVGFDVGTFPVHFAVTARVAGENTDVTGATVFVAQSISAYLCATGAPGAGGQPSALVEPADAALDAAASAIHLHVSKDALLGRLPSPTSISFGGRPPLPSALHAGDRLVHLQGATRAVLPTTAFGQVITSTFAPIMDVAPNTGPAPEYVLRNETANTNIQLLGPASGPDLAVAAGVNQTLSLTLHNTMPEKRLITLQYNLLGAADKARKFRITGPGALAVPAGESRVFNVGLNVSSGADPSDALSLRVRGTSAGHPGEVALFVAGLRPSVPLDPAHNIVYLHGELGDAYAGIVPPAANPTVCGSAYMGCWTAFLSATAQDPRAGNPDHLPANMFPTQAGAWRTTIRPALMANGIPLPAAFAPKQAIQALIKVRSAVDIPNLQVHAILLYGNSTQLSTPTTPLMEGTATITSTSAGTLATIAAPAQLPPDSYLPAGSVLQLRLEFQSSTSPGSATANGAGLEIVGRDSQIVFPLVQLPPGALAGQGGGPFQLAALGSREEFVNPGKARLFNASLLNQAEGPHTAHLTLEVSPATWVGEVRPGTDYTVKPGDALRLAVLLHAPTTAKEGERAVAWLNASESGQATASLRLSAVATAGVDLPDDATTYQIDEDAQAHLATAPPHKSPGPELPFLVALVAAMAIWRRRRA